MPARSKDWLTAYLEYTGGTECPTLYHIWTALGVISGVLQRRVYHEFGFQRIYANLYIVLVGPPGKCRKGTALGIGNDLLNEEGVDITMPAESITRRSLVNCLGNSRASYLDPETNEAMIHHSITAFSEELGVFMGENDTQLMQDLTDWYDCRKKWAHDTNTQGKVWMENVCVTIVAGTTPHYLENSLPKSAVGQGLASRKIFVVEERKSKIVPCFMLSDAERQMGAYLLEELQKIRTLCGRFTLTPEFWKKYEHWYVESETSPPIFVDPNFEGYLSRRATHLRKMSCLLSVSRGDDLVVLPEDFDRAMTILEATEKKMDRAFGVKGEYELSHIIERVGRHMVKNQKKLNRLTPFNELMRAFYRDCSKMSMETVLETLEKMKAVEWRYCEKARDKVYKVSDWYVKEKEDLV